MNTSIAAFFLNPDEYFFDEEATIPMTPYQAFHEAKLGMLIFSFLSHKDRKHLALVDTLWHTAKLAFDETCYKMLHSKIQTLNGSANGRTSDIYITDRIGQHTETMLSILGRGGSKKAIQLKQGRALLLPNMDVDHISVVASRWARMVYEEVALSQLLAKIGLLSPLSRPVSVSLSLDAHEGIIPAYLSETFESLAQTKGWFIIDKKNRPSSTWKQGQHFLFNSEEERLDEKNWDSVVDSLLTDIATICIYDIPTTGDSLNIAIVKKPFNSKISPYEVRYFGFDFSKKSVAISIPQIQQSSSASHHMNQVIPILNSIMDEIFLFEFGHEYALSEKGAKLKKFKDQLVEKYCKEVMTRIQLYSSPKKEPDKKRRKTG